MSTNKLPKVSIIFPIHNGGQEPIECLASIEKLTYPKSQIEVIVVDNNSTDGSPLKIKKRYPFTKMITLTQNIGFARAINLGATHHTGDYIFLGNDDLVFHPESLYHLVNYHEAHPGVGIVGGIIYFKSTPKRLCSAGYSFNPWTGNVSPQSVTNRVTQSDWVQGCALLIKSSLFRRLNGLDPEFELMYDDFDLATRVKKLGLQVVCIPQSIFWHGESVTAKKNKPNNYFHWYKSKFRYIFKYLPFVNIFCILSLQILLITPYRALILRDGRLLPFLKGLWWNVKHLPKTLHVRYAR